jgi:hypothetical protein
MPVNNNTRRRVELVKKAVKRAIGNKPTKATIYSIDGNLASLRLGKSPTLLKNIEIAGDPSSLGVGQEVSIQWVDREGSFSPVPVVMTNAGSTAVTVAASTVPVDDVTIYNGTTGLAVKPGGIDFSRLAFTPALSGHTHKDSLQRAGWQVTADGVIFKDKTAIHPSGQIALGSGNDIIKLDSQHADFRLWAGNTDPTLAPFSVSKVGSLHSTAGDIGGWNIGFYQLTADSGQVILNSDSYPYIGLGGAAAFGQNGIWVGKDLDGLYKLYVGNPLSKNLSWDGTNLILTGEIIATSGQIGGWDITANSILADSGLVGMSSGGIWRFWAGNADPSLAPFRVDKDGNSWLESATIFGNLQSSNFNSGLSGWGIFENGNAEFNNVVVRGELRTTVFSKGLISVHAGTSVWGKSSGVLAASTTIPASGAWTYTIKDPVGGGFLFESGDICQIKGEHPTGIYSTWFTVSSPIDNGDGTQSYTCTYNSGTRPVAFQVGTAIIDWGKSGQPLISLSADGSIGPGANLSVYTHNGDPWNGFNLQGRFGNLNGSFGVATNTPGIGIGDISGDYLLYTNGSLTIKGNGSGITNINGGNITTGTISASRIDVAGIFAQNATILGTLSLGSTGLIKAGDNTNGYKLGYITDGYYLRGIGGGQTQVELRASDGKLYFGGGFHSLSSTGITFQLNGWNSPTISWLYGATEVGKLEYSSSVLRLKAENGKHINIAADGGSLSIYNTGEMFFWPTDATFYISDSNYFKIAPNTLPGTEVFTIRGDGLVTAKSLVANYLTANTQLTASAINASGAVNAGSLMVSGYSTLSGGATTAQLNGAYYTSNTAGTDYGKWTRIASATIVSQWSYAYTYILLSGGQSGGDTNAPLGKLYFRVKQQTPMGQTTYIELYLADAHYLVKSHFVAIITQNDASATRVDLYMMVPAGYEIINLLPLENHGITIYSNQGYSSSLPAGTQIACKYLDGAFESVTSYGNITARGGLYLYDASGNQIGDIYADSGWLRFNTSNAKNIYTPRMFRADGGITSGSAIVAGPGQVFASGEIRSDISFVRSGYYGGIFVPYLSTVKYLYDSGGNSWAGGNKATGTYTFNLTDANNGLPSGIKGIVVRATATWAAVSAQSYLLFYNNTSQGTTGVLRVQVANQPIDGTMVIPVSDNTFQVVVNNATANSATLILAGFFL